MIVFLKVEIILKEKKVKDYTVGFQEDIGKESKGGKTQGGWIDCGSCGSKDGPKP